MCYNEHYNLLFSNCISQYISQFQGVFNLARHRQIAIYTRCASRTRVGWHVSTDWRIRQVLSGRPPLWRITIMYYLFCCYYSFGRLATGDPDQPGSQWAGHRWLARVGGITRGGRVVTGKATWHVIAALISADNIKTHQGFYPCSVRGVWGGVRADPDAGGGGVPEDRTGPRGR